MSVGNNYSFRRTERTELICTPNNLEKISHLTDWQKCIFSKCVNSLDDHLCLLSLIAMNYQTGFNKKRIKGTLKGFSNYFLLAWFFCLCYFYCFVYEVFWYVCYSGNYALKKCCSGKVFFEPDVAFGNALSQFRHCGVEAPFRVIKQLWCVWTIWICSALGTFCKSRYFLAEFSYIIAICQPLKLFIHTHFGSLTVSSHKAWSDLTQDCRCLQC